MTTTTNLTPAAPSAAWCCADCAGDVDGYVQTLPVTQLTATELYREFRRTGRERAATRPGTPGRTAVIERQQAAHDELHRRLAHIFG